MSVYLAHRFLLSKRTWIVTIFFSLKVLFELLTSTPQWRLVVLLLKLKESCTKYIKSESKIKIIKCNWSQAITIIQQQQGTEFFLVLLWRWFLSDPKEVTAWNISCFLTISNWIQSSVRLSLANWKLFSFHQCFGHCIILKYSPPNLKNTLMWEGSLLE